MVQVKGIIIIAMDTITGVRANFKNRDCRFSAHYPIPVMERNVKPMARNLLAELNQSESNLITTVIQPRTLEGGYFRKTYITFLSIPRGHKMPPPIE